MKMAAKPRIVPIGKKYNIVEEPRDYRIVVGLWNYRLVCGRWTVVVDKHPESSLLSYADPNLCKSCVRRQPKPRRALSKGQREERR